MAWRKSPQHMIDLFDEAVPKDSRIERRKMFGYPAAFLNGICSPDCTRRILF